MLTASNSIGDSKRQVPAKEVKVTDSRRLGNMLPKKKMVMKDLTLTHYGTRYLPEKPFLFPSMILTI